jgi:inhibitor of KinA sporulation pathway (predicted exonuclease)
MSQTIILFDLEYTAWEGSHARHWSEDWEHREIIQIAAIQITPTEEVIEMGHFDCLIRPTHNPLLSSYIIALTGIEQAALDARGITFPTALAAFYAFCGQGQIPLFCYGDDPGVMNENCLLNELELPAFPAGIYDIRLVFEGAGIDTRRYTSGTVHQAAGAIFEPAAHNALNDVRSMAVTLRQLIRQGRIGTDWAKVVKPIA